MAMMRGFMGRMGRMGRMGGRQITRRVLPFLPVQPVLPGGRSVTCALMRSFRLAIALLALGALVFISRPYAHGLSFVVRVAEMHGTARTIADLDTVRVQERDITIPTTRGAMRARAYEPPSPHRAALLTSGLHAWGIDEPRLVRLAR